ncbi:PAS domain S-box protein, partial [Myxococcota bacterium]|nr:PAS domain S-box protein [Myxococcota bacterium]
IAGVGSWEWEIATDTVRWSPELFRIFGMEPTEGAPSFSEHSSLYGPGDMERLTKLVSRCVEEGIPYELELTAITRSGDNRRCVARGEALKDHGGKITQLVGSFQDITEQARAREALRDSEERFRKIYEHMGIGVARVSLGFLIEHANEAYCRLLGYSEEELTGMHLADFTDPEVVQENLKLQSQLARGEIDHFRMEKGFIQKNGTRIQGILDSCLVRDAEGNPSYFLGSVVDITQQRTAEGLSRTALSMSSLRSRELNAILQGVRELLSGSSFATVIEGICEEARRLLSADAAGLALVEESAELCEFLVPGSTQVKVRESQQGSSGGGKIRMSLEDLPGEILGSTDPVLYNHDVPPGLAALLVGEGRTASSALIAPVHISGRSAGFIALVKCAGEFDAEQVQMANAFARLAAMAIQKMQAEQALQDEERRYRLLAENTLDVIWTMGLDLQFQYVNPAIIHLTGHTPEEWTGTRLSEHCDAHSLEQIERIIEQAVSEGPSGRGRVFETVMKKKDGSSVSVEVHGRVLFDTAGDPLLLQGTTRDITERIQMQAQLTQSDRLSSMGMLAAGVAHEINNPLSYVLFNMESLAEDLPPMLDSMETVLGHLGLRGGDSPEQRAPGVDNPYLQREFFADVGVRFSDALEGVTRICDITRGLGTFARVENEEPVAVDVNRILDSAIGLAGNEIKYRATLVKEYGRVPSVNACEGRLSQVFLNLIINACHAIDEGAVDVNEIRVRTWLEDSEVCVEVSDSGEGIPPDNLGRLFEPFFTTKRRGMGSGLGLAITKNIITGYGGSISVQSQQGVGTSFIVRLPAGEREVAQKKPAGVYCSTSERKARILIVDDEKSVRSLIVRILKTHDTVEACSGEEAREILLADPDFDVILCDLMMPVISGMELHQWVRSHNPPLSQRFVFISGGAFTPKSREYLTTVSNVQLSKPFKPSELQEIIASMLN